MHTEPLLGWDFIHVGALAWSDAREPVPCDVPKGLELRVEPARKTGPIFAADRSWEQGRLAWAQVMEDGGRYRMWYGVIVGEPSKQELLCYAESDDGLTWRKPELGLVEVHGCATNNVVLSGPGATHFSVVKCPHEPAEKRYRCLYFKAWWEGEPGEELDDAEGHHRLELKNAAKEGQPFQPVSIQGKMLGLNSPDGLRWTPVGKPVLDEWHDTHNICVYDEKTRLYRAYLRGFYAGRRAVSYSETADFENWPPSRVIHHHTTEDGPDESLYSNAYTRYPGRPDIHLMFPAIYHQSTDTTHAQLAVSTNGVNWSRFARQAIVPHGEPGDPDEGMVYPEPDLLRFSRDGVFRLLCHSGPKYHNEWYNEKLRSGGTASFYHWAEWTEDRLAGIHAAGAGAFTMQMSVCGERLLANYRTAPDGWVRFELVDRLVWPPQPTPGIRGRRFEDMERLTGDETHAPMVWNTCPDLSELKDKPVAIRVRLHKATLFSVTMYGVDEPLVREDPRYPV